jgi:hypothetical protein
MSGLKEIELERDGTKDLALIDSQDAVWLVVPFRWWDLATLLFWFFCPADRKARAKLTLTSGEKVSFRVVRVASRHIRIRGVVR